MTQLTWRIRHVNCVEFMSLQFHVNQLCLLHVSYVTCVTVSRMIECVVAVCCSVLQCVAVCCSDVTSHSSHMRNMEQTWLIHTKHDACTCNMTHSYIKYIWLVMTSEWSACVRMITMMPIDMTHLCEKWRRYDWFIYIWLGMTSEWFHERQIFRTYIQSRSLSQNYDQYTM